MSQNISDTSARDTESRILHAAEREFMTKGFAGARTTSIAEAAEVTHAMLHYYFRTKDKLFNRIITEKIAMVKDLLLKSVDDKNLSLEGMIYSIISHHLDFIAANPDLPRFIMTELFANPKRAVSFLHTFKKFSSEITASLQEKIDSESAEGKCRWTDARMLMLDIASLNIFPYISSPAVNVFLGNGMADSERFLAMRKKENYDTIMRKLKP